MQKKYNNVAGRGFGRFSLVLFLFFFNINQLTVAQETDSVIPDTANAVVADESAGPSLHNLSKNLGATADELERIRHEEIMSYVYMGLGFSVVIGIAWFTTVLARKRKRKEDEVKAIRMQNMKHKSHHHPRR